jgi:hypothetical protein
MKFSNKEAILSLIHKTTSKKGLLDDLNPNSPNQTKNQANSYAFINQQKHARNSST